MKNYLQIAFGIYCKMSTNCAESLDTFSRIQNNNIKSRNLRQALEKSLAYWRNFIAPETYYNFLATNEVALHDSATMMAFKAAIQQNVSLIKGAIVLEVGCGSALLSLWAAKIGAAQVIAIESSDMAKVAKEIVKRNNLDHVITVLQGNIESVLLPKGLQQVDIIISKWMGACLMYSSNIEDVICARDKWLKPGGTIIPKSGNLFLVAADLPSNPSTKLPLSEPARIRALYPGLNISRVFNIQLQIPLVTRVDRLQIQTHRHLIRHFDMYTLTRNDLSFVVPFELQALRKGFVNSIVAYFDINFSVDEKSVVMCTSPTDESTQWKQTVYHIDNLLPMQVGDILPGTFKVVRGTKHLDFDIEWAFHNNLVNIKCHKQIYRMQGTCDKF